MSVGNQRKRELAFFMTIEDEKLFCQKLREENPSIKFLSVTSSTESNVSKRLFDCVTKSPDHIFSIVNFELIDEDNLSKSYEKHGEYYHFSQIGRAQMQFLRSHSDKHESQHLQYGRIADSFSSDDREEKIWKNKVYNILKNLGEKIYWYYKTPEGSLKIREKAEKGIVALPNALQKYNGKNGCFLKRIQAKYVAEGTTVNELN